MAEPTVQRGKMVSISYMIRGEDDEIMEYTDLPISYLHGGRHELFPQIEQALHGRAQGETVTVRLADEEAFGPHDPGLTFTDDIDNAPQELRFVGAELEAQNEQGEVLRFRVTSVGDDKITVDANHPMAGQDITFVITITEVRDPTAAELGEHNPTVLQ